MRRVVLRASAKVNLALEVLGKRADGYHEIATVLHAVDLTDRIVLEDADAVALTTTARELPTGGENLCVRAARLLQESVGVERGVHIALDKRIPVAAGLGGGSSDAAAMLVGLTRLWRLRLGRERLHAAAVKLGMDVPFFLGTGRTLATGRGERLRALPAGAVARSCATGAGPGRAGVVGVLVGPNGQRRPRAHRERYGSGRFALGRGQAVRRGTLAPVFGGSNPPAPISGRGGPRRPPSMLPPGQDCAGEARARTAVSLVVGGRSQTSRGRRGAYGV